MEPKQINSVKKNRPKPSQPKNTLTRSQPKDLKNENRVQVEPVKAINSPVSELKGYQLFENGADDLLKGIVLAEVLGPPRSRRGGPR